ncbi:Putative NAD(P)-binding domain superfamily [Colletotrichum destructivum]|uniref:NAD(P)-binding domain superfamily n=1 Tax=Colletotrichum destructivum TaxID=34406 RepID=A0AAX4I0F4_9PEZI|nr:Putative NAD(P)-binding domain superfamily [Colletotrichum destructivum]
MMDHCTILASSSTTKAAAVILPGSTILVTRANVRDKERCQHIQDFFDQKYGTEGQFELFEVPNLTKQGAFDDAVKGCAGFVHLAVDNGFSPDPTVVVDGSVALTLRALEAAASKPGLRRFVLTSSYITACQYCMNEVYDVTQASWNNAYVEKAWAPPPYSGNRSLYVYSAAKVQCKQAMWRFVKEQAPSFVANAVLPDFVTGPSMPHNKPNVGPMSFALKALWDGGKAWKFLGPQWMVDAEDASLLHVGALLHPGYQGERIPSCAHRKS